MLVRTNPRLSGNIKITVDSSEDLWLNSIDASDALSNARYKKYRVPSDGTFEKDLSSLFGDVEPDVLFAPRTERSAEDTTTNFAEQYDFFYSAGAYPLISTFYEEDYAYFAPLWIRDTLPDYFVIFRIDEPLDFPYNENVPSGQINGQTQQSYKVVADESSPNFAISYGVDTHTTGTIFQSQSGITTYTTSGGTGRVVLLDETKDLPINNEAEFLSILSRACAVKTFDLTERSEAGRYLRKMLSDPRFPAAPMTVSFDPGVLSTWNGYSYKDGIIASKGEDLSGVWAGGSTQIDFEAYVTDGFARNGVVCPNLLNMEFLFEDPNIPLYSIPRYFGLYCSANELGSFSLSGSLLASGGAAAGNTPQPKQKQGYKNWTANFFQNNPSGVKLFYEDQTGVIPKSSDFVSPVARLFYVQDKRRQIHSINQDPSLYGQYGTSSDIQLRDTAINVSDFGGIGQIILNGRGAKLANPGKASAYLTVKKQFFPGDVIKVYNPSGVLVDPTGRYDRIEANDLRRTFTVSATPPAGANILIAGNLTPYYVSGDVIQVTYGHNVVMDREVSGSIFNGTDTEITITLPLPPGVTSGYVSIDRDWGPGSSLSSDDFTTVYFHPYGTNAQVAASIAAAFKSIETRHYTSLSMGSDAVLAHMTAGKDGNNSWVEVTMSDPTACTINGQSTVNGQRYYFGGGTNVARTRLRFLLSDSDKVNAGNVWLTTLGGISKIKWVGRYVDEPVQESGGSDPATYAGWERYATAYIEDDSDEVQVGRTGIYVAGTLFKPPVGVLSVFQVKDLDGDFYSSTYGRNPDEELYRYYGLQADTDVIVKDRGYVVKGVPGDLAYYNGSTYAPGTAFVGVAGVQSFTVQSGSPFIIPRIFCRRAVLPGENLQGSSLSPVSYTVDGSIYDGITYNATAYAAGTTFSSIGGTYSVASGSPVVYLTNHTTDSADMDEDLKSFPGFFKLKDFMSVSEISTYGQGVAYQLDGKFTYLDLLSEYDYLKENFLKENAIRSRMIPVICKWAYAGGRDSRDNPYRLNVSQVFGTYNFSPSTKIRTQNPAAMTHEWYYLEKQPLDYPAADLDDNYYFFLNDVSMASLADADPLSPDYFTDYFTFAPTATTPYQERFGILRTDDGITGGMLRGLKLLIRDVVGGSLVLTPSGKPQYLQNSTRFDGYKISTVIRVVPEDPLTIQPPVAIQCHANETHKTLLLIIDVVSDDYRTISLVDSSNLGTTFSPSVIYPTQLPRSIDYHTLYSMKSKRSEATYESATTFLTTGTDATRPGDIKLSVALDLSFPSAIIGLETHIYGINNPAYDWDLRDEVRNFQTYNSFRGSYLYGLTAYPYPIASTQRYVVFGIPGGPSPLYQFEAPVGTPVSIPNASDYEWASFPQVQLLGGTGYFEPIMQRLSAAAISDKINSFSPVVTYYTHRWNATSGATITTTGDYYLEVLDPTAVNKVETLIPDVDTDRPPQLTPYQVIGATVSPVPVAATMARHAGPYEPMFRDLFSFEAKDPGVSGSAVDLKYVNALFRTAVPGFAQVKNMALLKVAPASVLALSSSDSYKSLYPYVGECAVDYQDFFAFRSSWDPGFLRLYSTPTAWQPKAGTRSMVEQRCLFGSKIMKTQDEVSLQTWNVVKVADADLVDPSSMTEELVWSETTEAIVGYINSRARLRRFFVENGAGTEFEKYLMPDFGVGDPNSIDDDVSAYIDANVTVRYEGREVQPFVRARPDTSGLNTVDGTLTDSQKLLAGYGKAQNFTIQRAGTDRFVYKFRWTKTPNYNVDLAFRVDVARI